MPLFVQGDPCDANGDVFISSADHRPNSSDNYAYLVAPSVGDTGACCSGPEVFSVTDGQEIYFVFWQKYGNQNLFDSGAGKGPEIRGNYWNRIIIGPGSFYEDWSIPNPTLCSGSYRCATLVTLMNFPAYYLNGNSWRIYNSCDGLSWSQNIDTANPVYLERGYWYRFKLYVKVSTTNGRLRLCIQRQDWPDMREIIDTNINCSSMATITSNKATFTRINPSYNYNDHGGAGANNGFQIWLDDILVTDIDPDEGSDTTPPVAPIGLKVD